jgi:hypothetical protein
MKLKVLRVKETETFTSKWNAMKKQVESWVFENDDNTEK